MDLSSQFGTHPTLAKNLDSFGGLKSPKITFHSEMVPKFYTKVIHRGTFQTLQPLASMIVMLAGTL